MKRLLPAAAALALLAGGRPAPAQEATAPALAVPFVQGRPFAESLKRARAEKKPLMVDVYAVWCGPCKQLDRVTFADAEVGAWAKRRLVAVKVDAEKGEGRRIAARYGIAAFPTVLFLSSDGEELDRIAGVLGPEDFVAAGEKILAGQSPLQEAAASLGKRWSPEQASALAITFAQRNDVVRLRPVVTQIVEHDPDLAEPGARDAFLYLVSLEDGRGKLTPETLDLIATYVPRFAGDPREGILHVAAAREYARRGDLAGARASVAAGLKVLGPASPLSSDLYATLGTAESKAGNADAAIAAFRKGVEASEAGKASGGVRSLRQMQLAEALADAGKAAEARTAVAASLGLAPDDPTALSRAALVLLKTRDLASATARARRAVEVSGGADAEAQAALGAVLAAGGDRAGAAAAYARAADLEPDNADYRRRRDELGKKKADPKAS